MNKWQSCSRKVQVEEGGFMKERTRYSSASAEHPEDLGGRQRMTHFPVAGWKASVAAFMHTIGLCFAKKSTAISQHLLVCGKYRDSLRGKRGKKIIKRK